MFQLADCKDCLFEYRKTIRPNIQFPRVNTTCIHGVGVSTPSRIEYQADDLDGKFELINGDGDGTVNSESLSFCQKWSKTRDHFTFSYITLFGSKHDDVVRDKSTVRKVLEYVF